MWFDFQKDVWFLMNRIISLLHLALHVILINASCLEAHINEIVCNMIINQRLLGVNIRKVGKEKKKEGKEK